MATLIIEALRNGGTKKPEACPRATQDIELNTKNRQVAIDRYGYGPMNPNQPNPKFWAEKARIWNISPEQAKSARCGNCGVFIRSPRMLECIASGLGNDPEVGNIIDDSELGYCEMHDFKCAAPRTCNTWVVDESKEEKDYDEYEEE
jgi:hypothetical protein